MKNQKQYMTDLLAHYLNAMLDQKAAHVDILDTFSWTQAKSLSSQQ